jgi:lysophospholipase L1-like esterase
MASSCRRFLLGGAVAVVAASASCSPSPPVGPADAAMTQKLGTATPLLPLYRALSRTDPVVILQIGDSHTANDSFSGRLRELLQARFGDGGRGVLPPGVPYSWYRPARVTVESQGWSVVSSYRGEAGPFGVTGLRQQAAGPAVMRLLADDASDLNFAEIEVLRQPGGGTLDVELDGSHVTVPTAAPTQQAAWFSLPHTPGNHTLTLVARGDGVVSVMAWSVTRGGPGVIYANLGTPGATADLIDAWDAAMLQRDLAHLAPSLIVLAFGTNEGFTNSTDLAAYAVHFAARLHALHAAAPGSALMVLGPPDAYRRRSRDNTPPACGDPNWTEPSNLVAIRAIQRRIAAQEDAYFWDWQAAMGGPCSMLRWAETDPPMAAPDRVHLFTPGYQATAEILFQAIMAGYARYRALHPTG